MVKKFLILAILFVTNSLFANETYKKQDVEKMIAKMVIFESFYKMAKYARFSAADEAIRFAI